MTESAVRRNILALAVLQGANYILPLITLPYLLRVLGPENFGRVAFAQAFIAYFGVLTDYGFNLSATRTIAQIRNDKEALSRFVCTVTVLKAALMLAGFAAMLAIVFSVPAWRNDWPLYVLVYVSVLGSVLFPVWLFQGLERMRYITVLSIAARGLVVVAIFAFVDQQSDYWLAAALQAIGGVIAGLLALAVLPRVVSLRWQWPSIEEARRVAADGWHLFLSNAAISLYTSSNVFVLGLLTNPVVVGYFAAAEKLIRAVNGLFGPVSQAVYPHVADLAARSGEAALDFVGRLLRLQGVAALMLSLLLLLTAEPLVYLLFGHDYQSTVVLVKWMAALPLMIGLSNVFGIQTMLNFGMKAQFSRILMLSGLLNLLLLVALVPWLEAEGAALSVVLSETIVTTLMAMALGRRGLLRRLVGNRESTECH